MKTKIVYSIVSGPKDFYLEELLISIYSLRYYNPTAEILVVTDFKTYESFINERRKIFDYATKIVPIETPPSFSNMQKSRFLKTNLRNLIEGDYLFIDCDTIICSNLSSVDEFDCKIGAVLDYYGAPYTGDRADWDKEKCNIMGWTECVSVKRYNSGVLYVKDTEETHSFYDKWYSHWQECKERGINIDQLSLRKTLSEMPIVSDIRNTLHVQPTNRDNGIDWNLILHAEIVHLYDLKCAPYYKDWNVYRLMKQQGDILDEVKRIIEENPKYPIFYSLYDEIKEYRLLYRIKETSAYELWSNYNKVFSILDLFLKLIWALIRRIVPSKDKYDKYDR